MELIYAILIFFGFATPTQCNLSDAQYINLVTMNQPVIQFYHQNPNELQLIKNTVTIDRLED